MCRERTVRENDVKSMLNASDLQRVSAWYQTADMNHHRVDSREVDHVEVVGGRLDAIE